MCSYQCPSVQTMLDSGAYMQRAPAVRFLSFGDDPGNDLFIVWNRGWQKVIRDPHELNLVPNSEMVAVKLRWTFRK